MSLTSSGHLDSKVKQQQQQQQRQQNRTGVTGGLILPLIPRLSHSKDCKSLGLPAVLYTAAGVGKTRRSGAWRGRAWRGVAWRGVAEAGAATGRPERTAARDQTSRGRGLSIAPPFPPPPGPPRPCPRRLRSSDIRPPGRLPAPCRVITGFACIPA